MSTVGKKKTARNTRRRNVENMLTRIQEQITAKADIAEIISIRDTAIEKFNQIKILDDEIFDTMVENEDKDLDAEEEVTTSFTMEFKRKMLFVNNYVRTNDDTVTITSSKREHVHVKLPKIQLKAFNGEPQKWQSFIDGFNCAVHTNDSLSNIQKLTYLKNLVTDKAASIIEGISLSNDNYEIAMKLLSDRYNNKQLQVSSHMKSLLEIPEVKGVRDVESLRKIYDNIETQIRSLVNLGITADQYGPMLIPIIMSKLPEDINLIISRQFDVADCWDISKVLQILKSEIVAREKTFIVSSRIENDEMIPPQFSASALHAGNHLIEKSRVITCTFCDKSHKTIDCRLITNVEKRKSIIKEKRLCFVCLRAGHVAKNCRSKIKCYKCDRRHHTAICSPVKPPETPPQQTPPQQTHATVAQSASTVFLQTASTIMFNPNEQSGLKGRVLFDGGSQLSYITPKLANQLKLKPYEAKVITINSFGNNQSYETLKKVKLQLQGTLGERIEISCYVKDICAPINQQFISQAKESCLHLQNLRLADENLDNSALPIDVLIGGDMYWSLVTNEIIRGDFGPVAMRTKLGYILSGSMNEKNEEANVLVTHTMECQAAECESKQDLLKLKRDFSSVWPIQEMCESECKEFNYEKFSESITFDTKESRYVVQLPFKENHAVLPDNYSHCEKRFQSLQKKFSDPDLFSQYNDIIKEQLKCNIIEKVPVTSQHPIGRTHYLPHRPVVRDDKVSTRVRMVFDASAKTTGPSLNECLHPGPSLTEPLLAVLLRFRVNRIAFIADIEKSFLQILLTPEHRDYVRFLWYDDPESVTADNYKNAKICSYRLCRLLFGVTSSPCSLTSTIIKHAESYRQIDPDFVTRFLQSLHVDDLNSGADNVTDAYDFFMKAKERLSTASFNLRKFQSNSADLEKKVIDKFSSKHLTASSTKVLGINWDKSNDNIVFNLQEIASSSSRPTKRELLSTIATIYDPIGLINPFILKLKELFQRACIANVSWDQHIPDDLFHEWSLILDDLKGCSEILIPRFYGDKSDVVELHGFCDASLVGYGCCVYIRFVDSKGHVKVSLVTSQSRITPISKSTIPKLELQAAVLLSHCIQNVVSILSTPYLINSVHLYSDSTITLSWIKSKKRLIPYVQRRVDQIIELTSSFVWHHVDGLKNPADILSRGCNFSLLQKSSHWFLGPSFLYDVAIDFHSLGKDSIFVDDCPVQLGRNCVLEEVPEVVCLTIGNKNSPDLSFLSIKNFSSFKKLIRITALILRFVNNLKKKIKKEELVLFNHVTTEECEEAEMQLIKNSQKKLVNQRNYKQLQRDLNLETFDDGIIRCKGRLKNAPIEFSTKFPIIMPKDDELAWLIVKHYHEVVLHNGMKETINEVRKKYWIPQARNFVKRVLHKCIVCIRFEGKPYTYPSPPDLPECRLSCDHPFTFTGLDYAGPIYVKNIYDPQQMNKAWIFLYTCASTRGIYLDLVPDASAPTCIRGLRRFISDRGAPRVIISDNGTQFTAEETQSFATQRRIKWKFNLAAAPWWGGMFERMVRSTKRCLKKILFKSYLQFEEVQTILREIQATINNRPLTFLYEEPGEVPLTPNHLLFGRTLNSEQTDSLLKDDSITTDIYELSQRTKQILQHFWQRWKGEYLTELREHQRCNGNNTSKNVIDIGAGVIIHDDMKKRGLWNVGVVVDIIPSKDGRVRGAKVKYLNNGKEIVISRPINKLYPLEVEASTENEQCSDVQNLTFIDDKDITIFS